MPAFAHKAPVICNHGPPRPGIRGWGIAGQMSQLFFLHCPNTNIVWGKTRQTWQCNVKHTRLQGKTAMVLPANDVLVGWGHSRELQMKSQSPGTRLFPVAGGGGGGGGGGGTWLPMTG